MSFITSTKAAPSLAYCDPRTGNIIVLYSDGRSIHIDPEPFGKYITGHTTFLKSELTYTEPASGVKKIFETDLTLSEFLDTTPACDLATLAHSYIQFNLNK